MNDTIYLRRKFLQNYMREHNRCSAAALGIVLGCDSMHELDQIIGPLVCSSLVTETEPGVYVWSGE